METKLISMFDFSPKACMQYKSSISKKEMIAKGFSV
jgi:hypothetical protein